MRTSRSVVSTLILLAVVLQLTGCTSSGPDQAVVLGRSLVAGDPPVGDATYLLVPTGRIDVVIGDPINKVPGEQSRDLKDHRAPRGSVFIPVWLKFTNEAIGHPLISSKPQETALALVTDTVSVSLPSVYSVRGRGTTDRGVNDTFVRVPKDRTSVKFSATYDGLAQTVDVTSGKRDSGVAAGMYAALPELTGVCDSGWKAVPALDYRQTCESRSQAAPYLPAQGWAQPGRYGSSSAAISSSGG